MRLINISGVVHTTKFAVLYIADIHLQLNLVAVGVCLLQDIDVVKAEIFRNSDTQSIAILVGTLDLHPHLSTANTYYSSIRRYAKGRFTRT